MKTLDRTDYLRKAAGVSLHGIGWRRRTGATSVVALASRVPVLLQMWVSCLKSGSLAGQQGQHFDETLGRLQGDAATDIASMKTVSSAANVLSRATSEY